VRFHRMRHPDVMGEEEVNRFLTHLAAEQHVSPSTQNQALSAMLFLCANAGGRRLGDPRSGAPSLDPTTPPDDC